MIGNFDLVLPGTCSSIYNLGHMGHHYMLSTSKLGLASRNLFAYVIRVLSHEPKPGVVYLERGSPQSARDVC